MKKLSIVLLAPLVFSLYLSYAEASTCVDLKSAVIRRQENQSVLALQNFLYEKGYLKATPNGYFGVGTLDAVKIYQKSKGLAAVGSVGPATREAIRKESCTSGGTTSASVQAKAVETAKVVSKPTAVVVSKPTTPLTAAEARNAKRRDDLDILLRGLYNRFFETRGVHPVAVTETPIELCVVPPTVISTATATEVAVLVTPASPCKDVVDVTSLSPNFMSYIPRDPSIATTSTMTGYLITRSEYNDITVSAKTPENNAIIKATCNFNEGCQKIRRISEVTYDKPMLASSSVNTILRDAWPKKETILFGKNFTATNTVILSSNYTLKSYKLGTFKSTNDGTQLALLASSTNQSFSCGSDCTEKLPLGTYTLTVSNAGGTSNPLYLNFKGFNTSTILARGDSTIPPKTQKVKVASITISSTIPVTINSLTLTSSSTSVKLPSKISGFTVKNSATNATVGTGAGTIGLQQQSLYENESKIYDLYVDVGEVLIEESGIMMYSGFFTVTDTFGKVDTDLPIKNFSFTASY